jgi:hypothetical protein
MLAALKNVKRGTCEGNRNRRMKEKDKKTKGKKGNDKFNNRIKTGNK